MISLENAAVCIAGLLYLIVGVSYLFKKEYAWAMVWCAYGVANAGLMLAQMKK